MLSYKKTKKNPKRFLALTGVTVEEFEELLGAFQAAWEEYIQREHIDGKERQRAYGGGRKPRLKALAEKLFFILYYYKTYPIQEALAASFGMSQSQANEWLHRLSGVLKQALRRLGVLPERVPEHLRVLLADEAVVDEAVVDEAVVDEAVVDEAVVDEAVVVEVVVDGVERRRQRPADQAAQQEYYSGKKKAHTVKNILIVGREDREVKYLGQTHVGKKHDKKIADEEQPTFPEGTVVYQDLGFQGYAPAGVEVRQPKKKPRGGELTVAEKALNRALASLRVVVEHVISGVKRCRIVKDVLRNWLAGFADLVMEIACGLHTFRTRRRAQRTTQPAASS